MRSALCYLAEIYHKNLNQFSLYIESIHQKSPPNKSRV